MKKIVIIILIFFAFIKCETKNTGKYTIIFYKDGSNYNIFDKFYTFIHSLPYVNHVEIEGTPEPAIIIELSRRHLEIFNLNYEDIRKAVRNEFSDSIKIEDNEEKSLIIFKCEDIRKLEKYNNITALSNILVKSPDNKLIPLSQFGLFKTSYYHFKKSKVIYNGSEVYKLSFTYDTKKFDKLIKEIYDYKYINKIKFIVEEN